MASSNKSTLFIVFFTVFLDLVGFGILIPIQPFFAELLGASPTVVTWLGASFSLMQFLFAPFWGRLSDKVGRRPIMLVSIATTSIGYFLFGFAQSLFILFCARMLSGLGSANIGTAQAIIADSTPPDKRAKGMGLIGVAFGLGFIFGPAIGGLLVRWGLSVPIFFASGLSALNFILALFILPETRQKSSPKTERRALGISLTALKHAMRHPNVTALLLFFLIFNLAFSCMEQVLGLFIERTWVLAAEIATTHANAVIAAEMTTYVLIVVGVTATIVQGGLVGPLVKRFGEKNLLVTGAGLVSLSLFLIPITGKIGIFRLLPMVSVIMACGTGLINPSLSSLLSRSVDADERGGSLGLGQSLAALGRVFGPGVSGLFFEMHRALPFWIGSVLVFVCALIALSVKFHHKPAVPMAH